MMYYSLNMAHCTVELNSRVKKLSMTKSVLLELFEMLQGQS